MHQSQQPQTNPHHIIQQHESLSPHELTIIITTSPIKSHPSTQLIDDSIACINEQPALTHIHIYIVCDGVKIYKENKYKSGAITQQFLQRYQEYKQKLKQLYSDQQKYTIIQREHRHGFAENIQYIMQEYVKSDLVLIYQHDHIIDGKINFYKTVKTMQQYPKEINYITFMNKTYFNMIPRMCTNLKIRDHFLAMLGKDPKNYNFIIDVDGFTEELLSLYQKRFGMNLLPMNFWYDKVHIARKDYYLNVIFDKKGNYDPHLGKLQKTVSFVEDTFGHCVKWSIQENPELFDHYGIYVVWEKDPVFYHNHGRGFLTSQQKEEIQKTRGEKRKEYRRSSSSEESGEIHEKFFETQ